MLYEKKRGANKLITSELYPDCCVQVIHFPPAKILPSSDVKKPEDSDVSCVDTDQASTE